MAVDGPGLPGTTAAPPIPRSMTGAALAIGIALVVTVVLLVVTVLFLAPPARVALVGVVQLAGVLGGVAGVVRHRPARPVVWLSLLTAAALYSLAWWCLVVEAGPVAVAVCCTAAFLALGRVVVFAGRQAERDAAVDAVDVALLATAAASASLALVAVLQTEPGLHDGAGATAETWLAGQAAGAVVFAAAAAWAVATGRARTAAVRFLLVTAGSLVTWQLLMIGVAVGPGYRPGSAVDVALVPAWFSLVAATWAPSMRALGRPTAPTERRFPGTLAVLGAAVTLVVLPTLARYTDNDVPAPAVVAASAVTVTLLVVRQVLATRSARRHGGVDALTGLGSRRSLVQALAARMSDPASDPALLCVVDLEAFSDVNATRGHAAGDRALAGVAARLAASAPGGSRVYRVGGDAFAVLAVQTPADTSDDGPSAAARGMLEALAAPLPVPGGEVRLRARVGEVLLAGSPTSDPDDAAAAALTATAQLGDAELALGEAVRRGLPVVRATPHLIAARHDERALAARLPAALAGGEVVPHYQPIVRLGATPQDDRLAGFEALARWKHPGRGTLGADQLVPLAERLGVVRDVDEAVLEVALADCARWRAAGAHDLTVSVNASASSLLREDLVDVVMAALQRSGLPGSALVLEITEGSWLTDKHRIAERLMVLRGEGMRVAVDDFGTGYASLDYLVSFPVDSLKVDRSLVQRIAEPACARLLRGVVDIARDLDVLALAEGVGTAEHVELARSLGFRAAQGLALGPAVSADRVLQGEPGVSPRAAGG